MKLYSKTRSCWVSLTNPKELLDPLLNLKVGSTKLSEAFCLQPESQDEIAVLVGLMQAIRILPRALSGELEGLTVPEQAVKMHEWTIEETPNQLAARLGLPPIGHI